MADHEKRFQNAFVVGLQENGWTYSGSEGCTDYDKRSAIIPSDLEHWVTSTQTENWSKLVIKAGSESKALKLLIEEIVKVRKKLPSDGGGTYNLLLTGVTVRGIKFILFQPKPVTRGNSGADALYLNMIFRVVSEFYYSEIKPYDAIDLGFFINGIPVGTAELKSPISGQGVGEAENQYCKDRIPGPEMILHSSKGALFHFAVATDRASLTTALRGDKTRFIPFNTGIDNTAYLQKNPDAYYATSYLWKEVLSKENLALIIFGMMSNVEDRGVPQTRFPRYHQFDNLKKITESVKATSGRKNYLSQHAPGSGKSDEIANLAYALSTLHDNSGTQMYSSVIVITNRTVLDDQIKKLLSSKAKGFFYSIDKSRNGVSKSADLAGKLLSNSCPRIMSVTAQTFTGTLIDTMRKQAATGKIAGNYAVIIDEAHDGETGKQHQNMYKALLGESIGIAEATLGDDEVENSAEPEEVETTMTERAVLPSLNFFAYTATPNDATLRVFGEKKVESVGQITYVPFHTYSMHQAREEGYINDVLANYVTHERYVQIAIDDETYERDRIVDFTEGRKDIGKWMQTLPEVKEAIVRIIMEKMRTIVLPSLNGEGKAMLSCSSRREAVIYKRLIDEAIEKLPKEERFDTLVAYSGTLDDSVLGEGISELDPRLNKGLGRKDIATAFNGNNFRLMIVANKFQVGFDQPKLMCMFLDKPLKGINLIQTTARINRKIPGKETVYVFDFVNNKEQVIESFRKFDEDATLALTHDLSTATLDNILQETLTFGVHTDTDITEFGIACAHFDGVDSTEATKNEASMRMTKVIDLCSGRFRDMSNPESSLFSNSQVELEEYKALLRKFNSIYSLLSITRSEVKAMRAIYQKYGKQARFFTALSKALIVSRETDPSSTVDVNALLLKKIEITPQGAIGGITSGDIAEEPANYGGDVSVQGFESQLGPVEVLINEINDYPEIPKGSKGSIEDLIQSVIASVEVNTRLVDLARSTNEKVFSESQEAQKIIRQTLAKQIRNKTSGVSQSARILMDKQDHDSKVLVSIAQMLHKRLA